MNGSPATNDSSENAALSGSAAPRSPVPGSPVPPGSAALPGSALHGLACPRCGGMVDIPEGQAIVVCPYCDLRSAVSAENDPGWEDDGNPGVGVRRYQAPLRVSREAAEDSYRRFLSSNFSIARDCARRSTLSEAFLVHIPFWAAWGRGVAWAFGQERVGSGDKKRYEPRERKFVRELTWNGPACEMGEFGVREVGLGAAPLEAFQSDALHRSGMVFEPVGSARETLEAARKEFEEQARRKVKLDRTSQVYTRIVRPRLGLVYYPMWVMRYLYNGRSFQVVVDGCDGQVLYGKAPGSLTFRAAALVAGMAAGALVGVDGAALLAVLGANSDDGEGILGGALLALVIGLGIMWAAYRKYRHGEHYEHHRFKGKGGGGLASLENFDLPASAAEFRKAARELRKLR